MFLVSVHTRSDRIAFTLTLASFTLASFARVGIAEPPCEEALAHHAVCEPGNAFAVDAGATWKLFL